MAPTAQRPGGFRTGFIRRFLSPRARTWILTVPLHLLAFVVLYVATARIMESELLGLATEAAEARLEQVVQQLNEVALAHPGEVGTSHIFGSLIAAQWEINLQLLLPDGAIMGPRVGFTTEDQMKLGHFFRDEDEQRVWLSSDGKSSLMRGLRRVQAVEQCAPCHRSGQTLAVAAISLDLTRMVERVRANSRRNLAILIFAWAALLGAINIVVRRSVQRSAERLEAQLAAAEAGEPDSSDGGTELVLDPAAAKLHGALSDFLERQRQQRDEMAARMVHTDQLASLGQLAAGLAHEIKNPLAGIQGALEILREDATNERTLRLYGEMLEELQRVNNTLQLLLASARPPPPNLAPTDPETLVKETVYLLRPGFSRKNVSLDYEISPEIGQVTVDAAKIRQVLINLIQNAAEAIESEGRIVVRASGFPEQPGGLILAVEDDGPGIPPENQKKIFEPFYSSKFTGTGLGLAITQQLVEQHGGTLELDSEPGRGSTFYVLLPSADRAITYAEASSS